MLLHQVLHDEPRPPRRLNDQIPRDLETVCLKAMAKEPGRRYQTAGELAEDLRRLLQGEAVKARPTGPVERAVRWTRRRPGAAALLAVSALAALALVGLAVGLFYNARLNTAYGSESAAHAQAEQARQAEEEQRKEAEKARDVAQTALNGARRGAGAGRSRQLFSRHLPGRPGAEGQRPAAGPAAFEGVQGGAAQLGMALPGRPVPHGTLFLARSGSGQGSARTGSASPALSRDGTMRVYDVRTGQQALALKGPATFPVFSPDSLLIAVWDRGKNGVVLYEGRTGQEVCVLKGPAPSFGNQAAFSPDGSRIVVTPDSGDLVTRVYDAHTGQEAFALKPPALGRAAFSPDGARIFAVNPANYGRGDGVVRVYDSRTGTESFTIKGPAPFNRAVLSPDGTRIAAVDGSVWCDYTTAERVRKPSPSRRGRASRISLRTVRTSQLGSGGTTCGRSTTCGRVSRPSP